MKISEVLEMLQKAVDDGEGDEEIVVVDQNGNEYDVTNVSGDGYITIDI